MLSRTPHAYGRPLIGMLLIAIVAMMLFASRCGGSASAVIVADTSSVADTARVSLADSANLKSTGSRKPKKADSATKKREVESRNYLDERVDIVK